MSSKQMFVLMGVAAVSVTVVFAVMNCVNHIVTAVLKPEDTLTTED